MGTKVTGEVRGLVKCLYRVDIKADRCFERIGDELVCLAASGQTLAPMLGHLAFLLGGVVSVGRWGAETEARLVYF